MKNTKLDLAAQPANYGLCFFLSVVLTYIFALDSRSSAQPRTVVGSDEYPALQSFRLDQPGEHVFHFRQTHSREMTLLLEVQGSIHEQDCQRLTHLRLTIEATLLNHSGRTICHAVGSPREGVTTDNWVVRAGHGEAAFWHNGCSEIKLKRSEYTLTVGIRDVDPSTPKTTATPIFERSDNYGP
jgi:hypothetical protein